MIFLTIQLGIQYLDHQFLKEFYSKQVFRFFHSLVNFASMEYGLIPFKKKKKIDSFKEWI